MSISSVSHSHVHAAHRSDLASFSPAATSPSSGAPTAGKPGAAPSGSGTNPFQQLGTDVQATLVQLQSGNTGSGATNAAGELDRLKQDLAQAFKSYGSVGTRQSDYATA